MALTGAARHPHDSRVKVLLVGGGGREHALAWKIHQDDPAGEIVAAPGNPGIEALARCVDVAPTDIESIVQLAESERVDLTIVGPEGPLALGISDRFRAAGAPIFGPSRAAAEIETSKAFAKTLMVSARVPTANSETHSDPASAKRAARCFGAPVVIKASGLAAGKGVVVCDTLEDADHAIDLMLRDLAFGAAGAEILVEEFMVGEEISLLCLTDGRYVVPLVPAQDHKRLLDGDRGPNTGGMGAYAPVSVSRAATPAETISGADMVEDIIGRIVEPMLEAMRHEEREFRGLLYAGLMMTSGGPKVVEFNCRFGDPETQAVLPLHDAPLLPLLETIARGGSLGEVSERPRARGAAVATVLAAEGYPDAPRRGDLITTPSDGELPPDVFVFHAGTGKSPDGRLVTAGGRVLTVTGTGPSFEAARASSLAAAEQIEFRGRHFRRDIGWREARRRAGAP